MEILSLRERQEKERYEWIAFKKEINKKTYTRTVISIQPDTKTVQPSNFSMFIVQTERGFARLSLNKATNPPKIGSVIEFKVTPYKGSYDRFYISDIVQEIPNAGENKILELYYDEFQRVNG